MHPRFFGESRDITKRQIMRWLAPTNEPWAAHPMWFDQRPNPPCDRAFLDRYAAALRVHIVDGESPDENAFLQATVTCRDHLLLDPDTGLGDKSNCDRKNRDHVTHVTFDQFIRIVKSKKRQDKLTLVYDQGYSRTLDVCEATRTKLNCLRQSSVHAIAYMAEPKWGVCFIWASKDCDVITQTTQRMQAKSRFPYCRFIDDGCGHVNNDR